MARPLLSRPMERHQYKYITLIISHSDANRPIAHKVLLQHKREKLGCHKTAMLVHCNYGVFSAAAAHGRVKYGHRKTGTMKMNVMSFNHLRVRNTTACTSNLRQARGNVSHVGTGCYLMTMTTPPHPLPSIFVHPKRIFLRRCTTHTCA